MRLSTMLSEARNRGLYYPVQGVDGYAGEQDGDEVEFALGYAPSRAAADKLFPAGVPTFIKVHWSRYSPSTGWEFSLGAWRSDIPTGWRWPSDLL